MNTQRSSKSLVRILSGTVWFLVEFWTGIVFEHDVQSRGVVPSDRAEMGESTLPLELFLSCWNPKNADVSRGKQWTGRDVKAKEIRQVQRSGSGDNIIAQGGNFVIDSLSYWKPVQFSQKWWNVCAFWRFENESSRTILTFWSLSISCWGIPDNRELQ